MNEELKPDIEAWATANGFELSSADVTGATPTPGNAIERARGLESAVLQQAQDTEKRIESQTK